MGLFLFGVPKGIRTPVAAVKGRSPRPLDDGDALIKLSDSSLGLVSIGVGFWWS